MDKWQFMNLDSVQFNMDRVSVNTRPILNTCLSDFLEQHDGERWCNTNIMDMVHQFEMVCKLYGYSIELRREDDIMRVIVYATV